MHSELKGSQLVWIVDELQEFSKLCSSNDRIGVDILCDAIRLFFIEEPLPLQEYVHQLEGILIIRDTYLLGEGVPTTRFELGAVQIHLRNMLLAVFTTFFPVCLLDCLNLSREHVAFLLFCLPAHHRHIANPNQAQRN